MGFVDAIKTCMGKYFVFSGRASRSEYWWFYLFTILGSIVLTMVDTIAFEGQMEAYSPFGSLFSLIVLFPTIAAAARRLHDINRSGWWQLLPLIPAIFLGAAAVMFISNGSALEGGAFIGTIIAGLAGLAVLVSVVILIVWFATKGTSGPNRYGDDPLGDSMAVFD